MPRVSLPTTIALARAAVSGFRATPNATCAFPSPEAAPLMVIHGALDVTDHEQSRDVEMVTTPDPPDGPKEVGALIADTAHLAADGPVSVVFALVQAANRHVRPMPATR